MEGCPGHDCHAELEWFCEHGGLARVFPGGAVDHVDPFCYALPFVVRERFSVPDADGRLGLVEYVGVGGKDTKVMQSCQYRALRKVMRDARWGILSTRIKDGKSRTIEICRRRV